MSKTIKIYMMVFMLFAGFAMCTAKTSMAQTADKGDAILGKWTNEDKTRVIEFVKSGSSYEAVIKEAPDKSLAGKMQISGLTFSNGAYKDGKVHVLKRDKSFPCSVILKSNGSIELSAKAGLMSRTQIWTRVQ